MAFLITADPFNSNDAANSWLGNNEAISWLLIVANLAVFVRAGMRGIREARSRQTILELTDQTLGLAKELEEFQKSMPDVVAVSRSFERGVRKYLPSKEQVDEAVKFMGLDQRGLEEKDDEKAIFVEMTLRERKKGETALWYWAEDAKNIKFHKPSEVLTDSGSWVKCQLSVPPSPSPPVAPVPIRPHAVLRLPQMRTASEPSWRSVTRTREVEL